MNANLWCGARRRAAVGLAAVVAVACAGPRATRLDDAGEVRDVRAVRLGTNRDLRERSGVAMSRRQGAVVFMIEDSGNSPALYAADTNGADRGTWRVAGAKNVDWESVSTGPCTDTATDDARSADCVYIGDAGDNTETRTSATIYRVVEPDAKGGSDTVHASRLRYAYPDGPHDVEAMYVARNGDVLLITKRPRTYASGRLRPALVFALSASHAWKADSTYAARLVDSLPIINGAQPLMTITDAALSPDGKHLAVRTYVQTYIFATDSLTGRVNHAVTPSICDVTSLGEPQGEGVTWADDRGRLAFTTEGKRQPLRMATCKLPVAR